MKWILDIVGILVALMGALWILQGTNIVRTGFMAGHIQYALFGLIAVIAGIVVLFFANRGPMHKTPTG
jgi:uncharacterized integral membrane protein